MIPIPFLFIIACPPAIQAWGIDGHKIVAAVAEALLTEPTAIAVRDLLPHQSLVDISTWADEADHTPEYAWSKCLHYVDSDRDMCSVDIQSSCGGPGGCCVINAIANYTERLRNRSLSADMHVEALKFLVHFVGDASQPLHAGSKQDRGGNEIHVKPQFRKSAGSDEHADTNLHSVWDSTMIEEFMHENKFTYSDFANKILRSLATNRNIDIWRSQCNAQNDNLIQCPLVSSEESASLACGYAYVNSDGSKIHSGDILDREYFMTRVSVIEDRLASAGVRLGAILNSVFSDTATAELPVLEIL